MLASIDYKIDDLDERVKWLKVRKPKINPRFNINEIEKAPLLHAEENFNTIFNALDKEQTKIALVQFGGGLIKGVPGINHGYHTLSHHANYSERIEELQTIDGYILKSFQGFLNKLKESKLLDDTIVLFKCGMADANRHSGKHVPAFLFGGGFKHKDFIDCSDDAGNVTIPTTHLYSTILKQVGFNDVTFSGNKEIIQDIL
jgi:hypothetical protein